MIIDIAGLELTSEDRELLNHPWVGGVILFSRNYENPAQLKSLCQSIREACPTPLLISVDQEGGRVQRFREGFTRLPAMRAFGVRYEKNPAQAIAQAKACAWLMAIELLNAGIDISFAPVVDLDNPNNKAIHTRGFDMSPEVVSALSLAFISGMQAAGMAATAKHFPGHGFVLIDSHDALPVDERSFDAIFKKDLQPFIEVIRAGVNAMMPAHIVFPLVDSHPVGCSSVWLKEILRKKLSFQGVIISDDLSMGALSQMGDYPSRVRAALSAGCDSVLVCNNRSAVIDILNTCYQKLPASSQLITLKSDFSRVPVNYREMPLWKETREILNEMNEITA